MALEIVARKDGPLDLSAWTILLVSSLMLAPKNFVFSFHGNTAWSWQVIANPLTLLVGSAIVIWAAWRRNARGEGQSRLEASVAGA